MLEPVFPLWERATAGVLQMTMHDAEESRVLEELRLDGERWHELRHDVQRSLMAPAATETAAEPEPLARRLADHREHPHEIDRLLVEAARMEAARRARADLPFAIVERRMLALLKETGEFEPLRARADDKLARIASRADLPEIGEFSELKLLELRDWYFSRVLGEEMPDDIEQCVREWGYADLTHFHRAIFAEFVYRRETGVPAEHAGVAV